MNKQLEVYISAGKRNGTLSKGKASTVIKKDGIITQHTGVPVKIRRCSSIGPG